jgi:hypothetical protein
MTTEEFIEMLKKHDWYYQYSDDGSVYRAGDRQYQLIVIAKRGNPLLQKIYAIWSNHKALHTLPEVRDQLIAEARAEALITS